MRMRMNLPAARNGGLLVMLALWLALPAQADPRAKLAPPGPCAEPREAVGAVAPSSFSVVGPLQALFGPADVAAAPVSPGRGAPLAAGIVRPGPCDRPGAGCNELASPVARTGTANPIVPGARPVQGSAKPIGPGTRPVPSPAGSPAGSPGKSSGLPPGFRPKPPAGPGDVPGVRPSFPSKGLGDL